MTREFHFLQRVQGLLIACLAALMGYAIGARSSIAAALSVSPAAVNWAAAALVVLLGSLLYLKIDAERRAHMEHTFFRALLDHCPDNVFFKDRESRFLCLSKGMVKYFGYEDDSKLLNKTDADVFTSEHAQQALEDERKILETGRPIIGQEEKETWPGGRETWVQTSKLPLIDRRGRVIGTTGISHDVTERRRVEQQVHYLAMHDALTDLLNRAALLERLVQAIARAQIDGKPMSVLILDLDRFKNVNDQYGHFAGDKLLVMVASRLRSCVRDSDIVARFGGDEFVVVLPGAHDRAEAARVANRIVEAIGMPFEFDQFQVRTSASVGISEFPLDGTSAEELLHNADAAMYEAKAKGCGKYTFSASLQRPKSQLPRLVKKTG